MSTVDSAAVSPAPTEPTMSPFARLVAVFVRPTQAWTGLRSRAQWWFPLLITVLVAVLGSAAVYQRAMIPMFEEQWEQQVSDGNMPAEQADKMIEFFKSPAGMGIVVGQQAVAYPVITLFVALLVWFGVGFVLGTRMSYRLALEVASWSGLVGLPAFLITIALAWAKESYRGVHVGFGLLLPEQDVPNKLMTGLGVFLDGIGPLNVWYVVVAVIGAAALSGAPRKSVGWVLGGLYLVMMLFSAGLAAMTAPAGG